MNGYICNIELWNGLTNRIKAEEGADLKKVLGKASDYRKKEVK